MAQQLSGEPNLLFVRVADYAFRETTWCAGMRVCHICRTKFIHLFFEIFSQETTKIHVTPFVRVMVFF